MSNSPTLPPASPRKPTPLPDLNAESDARLQAALAASARAEASLNGLFRSIQGLGTGVGGAREANETLTQELEALRDMLSAASEQHMAFKQKVALLEQALDRTRKETDAERAFLLDQQDAFIVRLIDEQEVELTRRDSELQALRGRVSELERREPLSAGAGAVAKEGIALAPTLPEGVEPNSFSRAPPSSEVARAERAELERTARKLAEDRERARETVQRLQAQRDEAQSAVVRLGKERDEALQQVHRLKAELGGPRISSRPTPADTRRDSGSFRIAPQTGDLSLEALEMEARLTTPVSPAQSGVPSSAEPGARTAGSSPGAPVINSVLSPPRSSPHAAPLSTRLSPPPSRLTPPPGRGSPPPEELRGALTNPPPSAPTSRPVLKQKPDPKTRPLGSYSLNSDSIEVEQLEGVRLSTKPPRPLK